MLSVIWTIMSSSIQPAALNAYTEAFFGLLEAFVRLFGWHVELILESAIRNLYIRRRSIRGPLSMKLEAREYLYDIQRDTGLLRESTDGKTFVDYEIDTMLKSAVEYQFEVFGEAMPQLACTDEPIAERISKYQRIIAFRNVLDLGYACVDDRPVFNALITNIPTLV